MKPDTARVRTAAGFDTVEYAISEISAGRIVVVVDDEDRENEGDFIFAAEMATPDVLAFTIRYSSGVVCVPMTGTDCDRLGLPPMLAVNEDRKGTAYTVSVDATSVPDTGISAADRAFTIRALASADAVAADFTRPGHVFPLRAHDGGVLVRPGHTEAGVDLARLAGLRPAAGISEVVNDDGTMGRLPQLKTFAEQHDLALISIADLITYRLQRETQVNRVATTTLPLREGVFTTFGYSTSSSNHEVLALVYGDISSGVDVLTRVHAECMLGDTFNSTRCDCGAQLHTALERVVSERRGVVLYIRGDASNHTSGLDQLLNWQTIDNGDLPPLPPTRDPRMYGLGAQVLADLGITSMRVLTDRPRQLPGLDGYGLTVTEWVPLHAISV